MADSQQRTTTKLPYNKHEPNNTPKAPEPQASGQKTSFLDAPATPVHDFEGMDERDIDDLLGGPVIDNDHELFGTDEGDGADADVDSSKQGSEDEPDWVPMDQESLDAHLGDDFNSTFRDDMVALVSILQPLCSAQEFRVPRICPTLKALRVTAEDPVQNTDLVEVVNPLADAPTEFELKDALEAFFVFVE